MNQMVHGKVLTFGELMMRLSPQAGLRVEQAPAFDVNFGGAEANVASSLAFQGDDAAYATVLPNNRLADRALRGLRALGVDVSRVQRAGDRMGMYVFEVGTSERPNSVVYDRKYSAMSLANAAAFDWDALLEGVGTFYVSGITPAISPQLAHATRQALEACRQHGIATVCDLNYRGKMWSPREAQAVMRELLPLVDVCIANDEDASACLGIDEGVGSLEHGIDETEGYIAIAQKVCQTYGCKAVASVIRNIRSVEDSDWMGMLYDAATGQATLSPVHRVHVLEGVGGGDAFGAGLVHALLAGWDAQTTIDYAIAASVLKLGVRGDTNLVTEQEIKAAMGKGSASRVSR